MPDNRRAKGPNPRNFIGFTLKSDESFKELEKRATSAGIGKYTYAGSIFNVLWDQIVRRDLSLEQTRQLVIAMPDEIAVDKEELWALNALRALQREHPRLRAKAILSLSVLAGDIGFQLPEEMRSELGAVSRSPDVRRTEEDRRDVRAVRGRKTPPAR